MSSSYFVSGLSTLIYFYIYFYITDGSAGHDGQVPHVQGIPEGADEVAVDGKAGVSGFAGGDYGRGS